MCKDRHRHRSCDFISVNEVRNGCEGFERAPGGVCVRRYLRPVSGCINAGCAAGAAVATAGFGLLTFVLLLANSSRIVCGISGSNRTPCCEQPRAVRRSDIMTMEGSVASAQPMPSRDHSAPQIGTSWEGRYVEIIWIVSINIFHYPYPKNNFS